MIFNNQNNKNKPYSKLNGFADPKPSTKTCATNTFATNPVKTEKPCNGSSFSSSNSSKFTNKLNRNTQTKSAQQQEQQRHAAGMSRAGTTSSNGKTKPRNDGIGINTTTPTKGVIAMEWSPRSNSPSSDKVPWL